MQPAGARRPVDELGTIKGLDMRVADAQQPQFTHREEPAQACDEKVHVAMDDKIPPCPNGQKSTSAALGQDGVAVRPGFSPARSPARPAGGRVWRLNPTGERALLADDLHDCHMVDTLDRLLDHHGDRAKSQGRCRRRGPDGRQVGCPNGLWKSPAAALEQYAQLVGTAFVEHSYVEVADEDDEDFMVGDALFREEGYTPFINAVHARRLLSAAWLVRMWLMVWLRVVTMSVVGGTAARRDRHALVTVRPAGRPPATPGTACVFAGTQAVSGSLVIGPAVLFLPWWAIAALLAPTVLDLTGGGAAGQQDRAGHRTAGCPAGRRR